MYLCGAQLVSLNTQHYDIFNIVTRGIFMKYNNCGYVKKPSFLLNLDEKNNNEEKMGEQNVQYTIKFISLMNIQPRDFSLND
jgi:hypothetical protein